MVKKIARMIEKAYESYDGLFIYVVGRIGAGKTSFALHTLREVYGNWNAALDHLFFDIRDFMKAAYGAMKRGQRFKAVLIDDAGASLNALRFREQSMMEIAEVMNLARSFTAAVIFTTPDVYDVLKRVRVKAMFVVQVKAQNVEKSVALVYQTRYSAAYDKYYRKFICEIEFPRKYPVHERYMRLRKKYIIRRMKEIVGKSKRCKTRTYSITKVICPECNKIGILLLRSNDSAIYMYVSHGKEGECYLGSLRKNRDLLINLIRDSEELTELEQFAPVQS